MPDDTAARAPGQPAPIFTPADDAPPETWDGYYRALGRPDKPDAYELPVEDVDERFTNWARQTFHSHGLSKRQAAGIASTWQRYVQDHMAGLQRDAEAALRTRWKADYDGNLEVTNRIAEQYGFPPEALQNPEIREALLRLRARVEGRPAAAAAPPVSGAAPPAGAGDARAAAAARIVQFQRDPALREKLLNGDRELEREYEALQDVVHGALPRVMRGHGHFVRVR
jgi:hypothetical protein